MPLTREQADQMIERVRLTWEGTDADLNVTYRPNLLSRDEFRRMQEIAERGESDDDDEGLAPLLCRVIIGWDYLQESGEAYPITSESLSSLGYPIQVRLVREMIGGNSQSARRYGRGSAEKRLMPPIESSRSTTDGTGESMRPY